jgi:pimeloyl-ACP methyl ester carboxylesterase
MSNIYKISLINNRNIYRAAILSNVIYRVKENEQWSSIDNWPSGTLWTRAIPLKRNLIGDDGVIKVGYLIEGNTLYLTYSGTQDFEFWLYNADTDVRYLYGIGFHEGFLRLAEEVETVLAKDNYIFNILQDNNITKVIHCGHSAGGAVAGIMAFKFFETINISDACEHVIIDFGSPRYLRDNQPIDIFPCERLRFQEIYDIVPCTPLTWRGPLPGFEHFGSVVYTAPNFKISNTLPWYRPLMFIKKYFGSLWIGKSVSEVVNHHSIDGYSSTVVINHSLKDIL